MIRRLLVGTSQEPVIVPGPDRRLRAVGVRAAHVLLVEEEFTTAEEAEAAAKYIGDRGTLAQPLGDACAGSGMPAPGASRDGRSGVCPACSEIVALLPDGRLRRHPEPASPNEPAPDDGRPGLEIN